MYFLRMVTEHDLNLHRKLKITAVRFVLTMISTGTYSCQRTHACLLTLACEQSVLSGKIIKRIGNLTNSR